MQKALGFPDHLRDLEIRIIANPTPANMLSTGKALESSIDPRIPLVALASHGVYAWGKTPLEALVHAEALEFLCETTIK